MKTLLFEAKMLLVAIMSTYDEIAPYMFIGLAFAGFLHLVFKSDFIEKHMGESNFGSVVKAAIFGVPLPLCSCGVIPTAMHLRKQKASEGATLSFLISTPQTGIDSIVATYGMMGPIFAIFRPVAAFITGLFGGVITNAIVTNAKEDVEVAAPSCCSSCSDPRPEPTTLGAKLKESFIYAFYDFLDDISIHFLIGVILAGVITFVIPENFFHRFGGEGLGGMLIMMIFGIPLYVCATASIPIAVSLMIKGISPGAAFVFLVVGPATNAATITMIANVMGKKLVVVYLGVIGVFALAGGYLLNYIYDLLGTDMISAHIHEHETRSVLLTILTVLFSIVFLGSLYRRISKKLKSKLSGHKHDHNHSHEHDHSGSCCSGHDHNHEHDLSDSCCSGHDHEHKEECSHDNHTENNFGIKELKLMSNEKIFKITGMSCNHCVNHVTKVIQEVPGVEDVQVSLEEKQAVVKGDFNPEDIIKAVKEAGYKAE